MVIILQSNLSVKPPWPGIVSAKSFTLKALLKPLARNPPKGAMIEQNKEIATAWNWISAMFIWKFPKGPRLNSLR